MVLSSIVGFALGALFIAFVLAAFPPDPMLQRSFPCHEDEYLAYSRVDSERLECFHHEAIPELIELQKACGPSAAACFYYPCTPAWGREGWVCLLLTP